MAGTKSTSILDPSPKQCWRITGSVDTFVLSFIFTGSVKLAGSIAGAEMATKMVLYYLHERAWSAIRWDQQGQIGGQSNSS
jgi:uncharacterized membrane protein